MGILAGFAQRLPSGEDARRVDELRQSIPGQTGVQLALSHVELYRIYHKEERRRPFLARAFRRLAQEHLEAALDAAGVWPEPTGILGEQQVKEEADLWEGLGTLSKYIEKERAFVRMVDGREQDRERLRFCDRLVLAASTRCKLGQFAGAHEWFTEALETFRHVATQQRIGEVKLQDNILLGISGCLLLEFRYEDAQRFIDKVLSDQIFSSYQSPAIRDLSLTQTLLPHLVETTRNFEALPEADDLWTALMNDVQRCDSPEKARETRRKILDTIRMHDASRHIRALAASVRGTMDGQLSALREIETVVKECPVRAGPPRVELSRLGAQDGQETEEFLRSTDAFIAEAQSQVKILGEKSQAMIQAAQRVVQDLAKRVQQIAESTYRVPLRYRASWWWWSALRFVVRIVLIAYFLGVVVDDFLKKQGESWIEKLDIGHKEFIVAVSVMLIGLVLDHVAEKRLDGWNLPRYKRLLFAIVSDRSRRLWTVYNVLRTILEQAGQDLGKAKADLRTLHTGSSSS
jgi:hypothetical protein